MGRLGVTAGLYVPGRVLGRDVHFLYDTGATVTCLSSKFWASLPKEQRPELQDTKRKLSTVEGHHIPVEGIAKLNFILDDCPVTGEVHVCGVNEDAVLGLDILSDLRAIDGRSNHPISHFATFQERQKTELFYF